MFVKVLLRKCQEQLSGVMGTEERDGPRELDSAASEILLGFQAARWW